MEDYWLGDIIVTDGWSQNYAFDYRPCNLNYVIKGPYKLCTKVIELKLYTR